MNEKVQHILADKLEETARALKAKTEELTRRAYMAETSFQVIMQLQSADSHAEFLEYVLSALSETFCSNTAVLADHAAGRLLPRRTQGIPAGRASQGVEVKAEIIEELKKRKGVVIVSRAGSSAIAGFAKDVSNSFGFEVTAVLPMFFENNLQHMIFLGPRLTGAPLTEGDLKSVAVLVDYIEKYHNNMELIVSLRSEKEKLSTAVNSMSDGLVYTDTELNIAVINPVAVEMFGPVGKLRQGDNLLKALQEFQLNIRVEEILVREEDAKFEMALPAEGLIYSAFASKIKDAKGHVTGLMLTLHDVSEERYAERLKTVFMATISHKLRTPITIIKEGVSMLHEGILGELNPKQKSILEKTYNQSQYFITLINSLLEFTRTQADVMATGLHKTRENVNDFLQALTDSMKQPFERKQISLEINIPDKGFSIYMDKDRLQTAIGNILDNAVKFSPEGSVVNVVVSNPGNIGAEIVISDVGPGISKEYLGHIFESFTQVDKDMTGQVKGMGLGLYMAKQIVTAHGGTLTCESQLGKGTKFVLRLPMV